MKKPYIICHMMTSVDGRIDCSMTAQLSGVEDYYSTLAALSAPTTVSGRVTAELEMAKPGKFKAMNTDIYGKKGFSKKADVPAYEIVVDTKGTLLWSDASSMGKPYLIITSEQVTKEYLDYLDGLSISWIVCGIEKIDLVRASEILAEEFHVERMAIVGGSAINTGFLDTGLLDEVSILIGAGIDGRNGFPPVFDGLNENHGVTHLKLMEVKKFDSDAVWIRYKTN